jgi:hypothetical protein
MNSKCKQIDSPEKICGKEREKQISSDVCVGYDGAV